MTTERYNPGEAEPKWQAVWQNRASVPCHRGPGAPEIPRARDVPLPSGRIHMGHVRNYAMGDVLARYMRARGHNVLHPMGWDAFGMPAENAAIERGVHPRSWTYADRRHAPAAQIHGPVDDWSREIATCDPDYYRHEQAMFVDFMAAGLVERRTARSIGTRSTGRCSPASRSSRAAAGAPVRWSRSASSPSGFSRSPTIRASFRCPRRPDRLARKGPADAAQLDWPLRLRLSFDLVDSEGRPLPTSSSSTPPATTPFSAPPSAPLGRPPADPPAGRASPEVAQFRRECAPSAPARKRSSAEKKGLPLALFAVHPFRPGLLLPVYAAISC